MQSSNLNKTIKNDINLLVTLYFLLKHKKVSAVANEMFIGQSAVSHQLNKLRAIFDNELLVRTAKGMRLTPFAEQIYPEVEGVLAELESLFTRHEEVSPHLTPRKPVYRVCMPDNVYMNDIASLLLRFVEQEKLSDKVIFEVFERYDQCVTDLNDGKIDFFSGR
ncbi:LysR family transcriptional regulator [Mangrovibacter sp. SLW1]